MQKVDLQTNEKIRDWLNRKNKSKNTRSIYIQGMFFYTELIGKTPDELIEEAKNEQRSSLMMDRKIIRYLNNFQSFLEKRKLAPKTINIYICGVRSFYRMQYIDLPDLDIKKAKPLKKNRVIPTKEDLQDVLKICEPLEKAIILAGVSSGLSDIDIVNLKYSDFKNGYDPENKITMLQLTRHKLGEEAEEFTTFLSPEATIAINEYLKFRSRKCKLTCKREIDRLEKQRIKDDGYLFIKKCIPPSYLESGNEEERKITEKNLVQIYRSISERAQKNTPFGDWNIIRSHNMRKYFYNVLINNECTHNHAEHMMGHVLDNVRDSYFVAKVEELKKSYLKCVPYLTIQKELDISVSPEYLKMKERNAELESENYRVNVEREEIQRLKVDNDEKFNDLNSKIVAIIDITAELSRFEFQVHDAKQKKKKHPNNKMFDKIIEDSEAHVKILNKKLNDLMKGEDIN